MQPSLYYNIIIKKKEKKLKIKKRVEKINWVQ